jgi:hypothetical protein
MENKIGYISVGLSLVFGATNVGVKLYKTDQISLYIIPALSILFILINFICMVRIGIKYDMEKPYSSVDKNSYITTFFCHIIVIVIDNIDGTEIFLWTDVIERVVVVITVLFFGLIREINDMSYFTRFIMTLMVITETTVMSILNFEVIKFKHILIFSMIAVICINVVFTSHVWCNAAPEFDNYKKNVGEFILSVYHILIGTGFPPLYCLYGVGIFNDSITIGIGVVLLVIQLVFVVGLITFLYKQGCGCSGHGEGGPILVSIV